MQSALKETAVVHCFLVGGLVAIWIIFPYIGFLIIPIDFHIFQRGGPTTNQFSVEEQHTENISTNSGAAEQAPWMNWLIFVHIFFQLSIGYNSIETLMFALSNPQKTNTDLPENHEGLRSAKKRLCDTIKVLRTSRNISGNYTEKHWPKINWTLSLSLYTYTYLHECVMCIYIYTNIIQFT